MILGAPGSGKTTLLLELARDLLDRAEQDEQHLMPVVFNLSSWAAKQPRLTEWLVEELISKYQVPPKLARAWVDTDQILPCSMDSMRSLLKTGPHVSKLSTRTIRSMRFFHLSFRAGARITWHKPHESG